MSVIDVVSQRFLKIAAERWPEDIRDDQAREWAGELYAIRHDDERGRLRRRWAQLRYALSLAASPPVEDPNKIPKGWSELLPNLGSTMRRVLMLVAVGAVCGLASLLSDVTTRESGVPELRGVAVVVFALVLCEIGRHFGRVAPMSLRHDGRGNSIITAATVLLVVGTMVLLVGEKVGMSWSFYEALPYLVWILGLAGLAALVFRLARRGKVTTAWLLGLGGAVVLFEGLTVLIGMTYAFIGAAKDDATSMYGYNINPDFGNLGQLDFSQALLWFPHTLRGDLYIEPGQAGAVDASLPGAVLAATTLIMPGLLAASGFAIGYLISSGRYATALSGRATAPAKATAASTPEETEPAPATAFRRILGLAFVAVGILTWAFVLSALPPVSSDDAMVDLREAGHWAIVLAALGLALARTSRGWMVVPSLGFGASLLVVGVVVDRIEFTGIGAFLICAGIAGALAVAAWLLPAPRGSRQFSATRERRALTAVTVFAAYCAPAVLTQARIPGGSDTVSSRSATWLPSVWWVLSLSLIVLAVAAVWVARRPRLSAVQALALFGPPIVIMAVIGALAQSGIVLAPNLPVSALALGPLSVYLVAIIQWGRRDRGVSEAVKWSGRVAATLALAVPLYFPQAFVGILIGEPLILLSIPEGGHVSGIVFVPGMLLGATVLATFFGWWTSREPAPRPASEGLESPVTGEVAPA